MAKKKTTGSVKSKSKYFSKMARKFSGPQDHYSPAVARDVSLRGKTTDYTDTSVSLSNANSTAGNAGKSQFIYGDSLYATSTERGGSPTVIRRVMNL